MKGLLLAEKPSVMRAIKDVYEKEPNYPDNLDFGAFHGHLMTLYAPEDYNPAWQERKNSSVLPMIPSTFRYKAEDEKSVSKLLKRIKDGHYDYLINACDAGREGELIFWSFYETTGIRLPVKRFWASSTTKPAILKALYDLKDSTLYNGLRQAAKFRAQFDWLVGMNFTRAASNASHFFIPIGRVQSPTLKLIVDREQEIAAFHPQNYFEIKGLFLLNGKKVNFIYLLPPKYKETRFKEKKEAEKIAAETKKIATGIVSAVKDNIKSTDAPTLYSLAELQKDANKYLKFKPEKTLSLAQNLYEEGLLTYPRTESRFLPTDMIPEIKDHLEPLRVVPELAQYVAEIGQMEIDEMLKKNYINDAGITDHHAILPTADIPNWSALSKDEQALYTLVGKQFLAIFMPPYKVALSTILVQFGNFLYQAKGRREIDRGYGILYSTNSKDILLPSCQKGDIVSIDKISVLKSATKPPQRYTPRTILAAMQSAGNNLPDAAMRKLLKESAGLGTSATRADILKKIEDRGFVELNSNTYYATEKGIRAIESVSDRTFCSVVLTAQWEERLQAIEANTYQGDFKQEMEQYIRAETAYLLDNLKPHVLGICPVCGGNLFDFKKSIVCQNHKKEMESSCPFWIPKIIGGYNLTDEDMKRLLDGKDTEEHIIKNKSGKDWNVKFFLDENKFFQVKNLSERKEIGPCPKCGRTVYVGANNFYCKGCLEKNDAGGKLCDWTFPRKIKGTILKDEDVSEMLKGNRTREMSFIWNTGNQGRARLYLKDGILKWEF